MYIKVLNRSVFFSYIIFEQIFILGGTRIVSVDGGPGLWESLLVKLIKRGCASSIHDCAVVTSRIVIGNKHIC